LMLKVAEDAVKSAEQYGAAAGLGVLVMCGVPIAAIIACVTVVGLFIGISTLFIWYASLYFAQVIVGAVIGQWLMGRTSELWPLIGRMTVGLVILRLCTTIPHLGGWVKLAAILWGIGAISLALYRRFQAVIATSVRCARLSEGRWERKNGACGKAEVCRGSQDIKGRGRRGLRCGRKTGPAEGNRVGRGGSDCSSRGRCEGCNDVNRDGLAEMDCRGIG